MTLYLWGFGPPFEQADNDKCEHLLRSGLYICRCAEWDLCSQYIDLRRLFLNFLNLPLSIIMIRYGRCLAKMPSELPSAIVTVGDFSNSGDHVIWILQGCKNSFGIWLSEHPTTRLTSRKFRQICWVPPWVKVSCSNFVSAIKRLTLITSWRGQPRDESNSDYCGSIAGPDWKAMTEERLGLASRLSANAHQEGAGQCRYQFS